MLLSLYLGEASVLAMSSLLSNSSEESILLQQILLFQGEHGRRQYYNQCMYAKVISQELRGSERYVQVTEEVALLPALSNA